MRRILVVVTGLVVLLTGCGARSDTGAHVLAAQQPDGDTFTLISPLGTARVTVGAPTDKIDQEHAADGKSHRAPDDGAFVPVAWTFDYSSGARFAYLDAQSHPATISLLAGGHSYRIDTIGRSFGYRQPEYVAVPTTKDLRIDLTYDGLTQTVDVESGKRDSGVAEALYAGDREPRTVGCSKGWQTSLRIKAPMKCTLHVMTVPWAGDWAAPGHEYVVVRADIRPYPLEIHHGSAYARYDVRTVTDKSTVDGVAARTPLQQDSSARYAAVGTQVFDVPTGSHTLDLELVYALQDGGETVPGNYPLDPTVTFSRSVPLS